MKIDAHLYYNLEDYLLEKVQRHFQKEGWIGAFDFFSIVIWKANRAKSYAAERILAIAKREKLKEKNLNQICHRITEQFVNDAEKENMRILFEEWEFSLPTASAILAILYPTKFTIYDYRVAKQVRNGDPKLKSKVFEKMWEAYQKFQEQVRKKGVGNTLREKDRYLFGKSQIEDLKHDIKFNFKKRKKPSA
jgi:hypothetical protein